MDRVKPALYFMGVDGVGFGLSARSRELQNSLLQIPMENTALDPIFSDLGLDNIDHQSLQAALEAAVQSQAEKLLAKIGQKSSEISAEFGAEKSSRLLNNLDRVAQQANSTRKEITIDDEANHWVIKPDGTITVFCFGTNLTDSHILEYSLKSRQLINNQPSIRASAFDKSQIWTQPQADGSQKTLTFVKGGLSRSFRGIYRGPQRNDESFLKNEAVRSIFKRLDPLLEQYVKTKLET